MRISSNTIFDKGIARMGELQTGLARTQQQVSTGRRILSPSDDPVASARALEITNSQEINAKYAINRRTAKDSLSTAEGALQSVTSLLQDVKTVIVEAGNGVLSNTERQYIATELQGRFDELLGLANSRDGVGNYLFSGYQSATQPFAATANGAAYSGDQGPIKLQVHNGRQMEVSQNGYALFEKISSSNTFVSATAVGSATISTGAVTDLAQLTGDRYDIDFADNGLGGFDYTVSNLDDSTTVATGTYQSGQAIAFEGLEFTVTGVVAAGDKLTVRPTSDQSVFTTLKNLIGVLQAPGTTPADKAKLANGLSIANTNADRALDHVLTARATIGSNLKEIDSLDALGEDINVQYAQSLSELQDLDYVQAITELTKQQTALQAAQQSYIKVTSLSLFNFLP